MPYDTRYIILAPITGRGDEPVRYACQEWPCVDREVILGSDKIDIHAMTYHGSSGISVEGPYN